ncbi:hypothetical protein JCGZ_23619 [Jatropha curcas]|uniref:Uncharacterized protein n=1 Tax=Jatropha curcas TaxID=180498 RepID=A0A067LF18_JATCU|nr:hypothetical protein JCGZ_23619 [Jatropha curcas]
MEIEENAELGKIEDVKEHPRQLKSIGSVVCHSMDSAGASTALEISVGPENQDSRKP